MSEELISKQNLIKELKEWLSEFEEIPETLYGQGYDDAIKAAIAIVENEMPTNEKTGRWINIRPLLTAARCSECKSAFAEKTNFCPNCGAKMESEVE